MLERDFAGTERFEVRRRLGQGGMGVVYEAFDRARSTVVALKTLTRFDAQAIYRMKQEFRVLADVSHPNLAQLYELVSSDDRWFFTMELVEGMDFLSYLRGPKDGDPLLVLPPPTPAEPERPSGYTDTMVRPEDRTWSVRNDDRFSTTITLPDLGSRVGKAVPPMDPSRSGPDEATRSLIKGARNDAGVPAWMRDETSIPKKPRVVGARGLTEAGLERVRHTTRQLAAGIIALHDSGKLHRDIKPSNVMVTPSGRVVLLDFGLVTEMYERWLIQSTMEGALVGTVAYMAPEQSVGAQLAPSCDWYSVGVMLFEALTGRLPFEGRLYEIIMKKQELDPPHPRELVPSVPDDLDRLCFELLSRRPEDRLEGREVMKRLGEVEVTTPWFGQSPSLVPDFVGRRLELSQLGAAFEEVKRGRPVVVHVVGRSGIGKTALVRQFLEDASSDPRVLVLSGRCFQREIVPYKALDTVIDALSRHLRKTPKLESQSLLRVDLSAIARVFPVLRRVEAIKIASLATHSVHDPLEVRRRAFDALRALFDHLARKQPLIIAIDDVQWGDEDSASLLASLMRPPRAPPLLLIATYRSGERDRNAVARALSGDTDSRLESIDVRQIEVGPLAINEAERLAQIILARAKAERDTTLGPSSGEVTDPAIRAVAIARESDGSPLFVHELASFAYSASRNSHPPQEQRPIDKEAMPEIKLHAALRARCNALPEDARRLLETVAIAGRPIAASTALAASDLGASRSPIVALMSTRLIHLRHHGSPDELLEIYHDRIAEAVVGSLSRDEVSDRHRAIIRELMKANEPDPEALVHHLRAVNEHKRAVEYAIRAAERAFDVLAFDRAANLYRVCVELATEMSQAPRPLWLLHQSLGDALVNAGRATEAGDAYLEGAHTAPRGEALELKRRAAEQLLRSGYVDRGSALLREVLTEVGLKYPEKSAAVLPTLSLHRVGLLLTGFRFRSRTIETIREDELQVIDVLWSAVTGFAMVDLSRAALFHTRNLRLSLRAGDPYRLARALAFEATLVSGLDRDPMRASRLLDTLRTLAGQLDHPHATALAKLAEGLSAYFRGSFARAVDGTEQSLSILTEQCSGVAWEIDTARVILYGALVYHGRLAEVSERVHADLREAALRDDLYAYAMLRSSSHVSLVWLATGKVESARAQLRAAMARWSQAEFHQTHLQAIISEALFDLYEGEGSMAFARLMEAWEEFEETAHMRLLLLRAEAHFARARCALAAARSMVSGRERAMRVAIADVKRIEGCGLAWARPVGELVRAGIAAAEGDRAVAVERLARAEQGFKEEGMELYRAAAIRSRGELLGGHQGRLLIDEADAWMRAHTIVDPERMTRTLSPVDARTT
jgi:Cdc6-like AAA superfamily ATPase